MHTLGRLAALTVSTALLAAAPTASLAASSFRQAEGRTWTTVGTFEGGKHQACKVLINDGTTWKIHNRLVNGRQGKVGAGMTVQKNGVDTQRTWDSGLIARGATSKVGAVAIPKGKPAFTLVAFQYAAQAGTGGPLALGQIGRC